MRFLVTGGTGFIGWRVIERLLARQLPVVAADANLDAAVQSRFERNAPDRVAFVRCDVSEYRDIAGVFRLYPDITHAIHLAYLMSAEVEANPHLAARVNVLGMVNMFEACANEQLRRLVFTSSETVYGASQNLYGDVAVKESDFCAPGDHFFTYGVMKLLNEFMAQKYVKRHGVSIACVRPPVVFGHGRKRGSILWAEDFVSRPALGQPVTLPFSSANRECWLYVDDCAEQIVRLSLKPELNHFAYNSTGHSVSAGEFAGMVRKWIPDGKICFDESIRSTPLVDNLDGTRLAEEIDFLPRPLSEAILAHINEARAAAGLFPIGSEQPL